MKFWTNIKKFFTPINVTKNEILITEYWEEDKIRKKAEAKIVKHSTDHYMNESIKIKNSLEEMGASNLLIIVDDVEAPKLQFTINKKPYTTNCIFDFTYENVMKDVNNL